MFPRGIQRLRWTTVLVILLQAAAPVTAQGPSPIQTAENKRPAPRTAAARPTAGEGADPAQSVPVGKTLERAQALVEAGDLTGALSQVENARELLEHQLPLDLVNTTLVKEPAEAKGVYEPKLGPCVPGKPLYVYTEPVHFDMVHRDGRWRVHLTGDVEFQTPSGMPLVKQEGFFEINLVSRHRLREIFVNAVLNMSVVPPGEYRVLLRVRSENGSAAESTVPVIYESGSPEN